MKSSSHSNKLITLQILDVTRGNPVKQAQHLLKGSEKLLDVTEQDTNRRCDVFMVRSILAQS